MYATSQNHSHSQNHAHSQIHAYRQITHTTKLCTQLKSMLTERIQNQHHDQNYVNANDVHNQNQSHSAPSVTGAVLFFLDFLKSPPGFENFKILKLTVFPPPHWC